MFRNVCSGKLTFKSLNPLDLTLATKKDIREYFENAYDLTESLFTSLKDESVFYKCPDRLRLPLIFYFCHTAVVYANKLLLAGIITERVDTEYEVMFETGVNEMSWDDTENFRMGGSYQWPSLDKVVSYRRRVKDMILNVIENTPLELPIDMESPWWAVLMGIEHDRVHFETSSVLIRQLPVDMVTKPDGWVYGPIQCEPLKTYPMVKIEGRTMSMGKPTSFPSYGWDNEYGQLSMKVPTFEVSKYLITNGQFLEFVLAGGYNNRSMWSEEGWKWKSHRRVHHPVFWVCDNGCNSGCGGDLSHYTHCRFPKPRSSACNYINGNQEENKMKPKYMYRAMFDVIALPMDWPVDVNYHEARAYCVWKGSDYRLITEAEHNVIRGDQPLTRSTDCDLLFRKTKSVNCNMKYGSPTPANMHKASSLGVHDAYGNVWEWTEDHYNGLEEFQSHYLYDDFSSPCFDGQHHVMLGGSWASVGVGACRFTRNAFRRHFFQHCGFRVVRTIRGSGQKAKVPARFVNANVYIPGAGYQDTYETLNLNQVDVHYFTNKNIHFQYESKECLRQMVEFEFGHGNSFPIAISELCVKTAKAHNCGMESAVWIGSGVGKGPFSLNAEFNHILGIDFCGRFVDTAMQLLKHQPIELNGIQETIDVPKHRKGNVMFKQFTWLPHEVGKHDMTIVTFLERVSNPKAWLVRLWDITKENGLVVIASADGTWKKDVLLQHLDDRLKCICVQEVPYEGGICNNAMVTIWAHKN